MKIRCQNSNMVAPVVWFSGVWHHVSFIFSTKSQSYDRELQHLEWILWNHLSWNLKLILFGQVKACKYEFICVVLKYIKIQLLGVHNSQINLFINKFWVEISWEENQSEVLSIVNETVVGSDQQ
jgi:hypothetical protein